MSLGKKIAIAVVAVLAVAFIGVGVAVASWYGDIQKNIAASGDITNLAAPAADEPYYVLLIGSDSRDGWSEEPVGESVGERTDSIMVARVDEKNQKVSIISMPRDLRVYVDGYGYCKINSAVEHGGYDVVIRLLNNILGININYYAKIYFNGFEELVDTLGGVTVAVPEYTSYNGVFVPAGDAVTIDGIEALTLARCRHGYPPDQGAYAMGDFQRTLNQRNLVKAIAKKVLEQDITQIPGLITSLSHCIETNMSVEKIIGLATNMKGMDTETIESAQLPIGASTVNNEWYALLYQDVFELVDKNFKEGRSLFYGLDNFNSECNDDDVNGNFIDGPVYSYTTYSAKYGSPYSIDYTPSSMTQEAIERTKAGVSKSSKKSSSK